MPLCGYSGVKTVRLLKGCWIQIDFKPVFIYLRGSKQTVTPIYGRTCLWAELWQEKHVIPSVMVGQRASTREAEYETQIRTLLSRSSMIGTYKTIKAAAKIRNVGESPAI